MLTKADTRKATISARVYRASTGQWEDLGIIWQTKGLIKNLINRIQKWLQL